MEPFFSPDSQWFGFCANGTLKKASVQGGQPVDLVEGLVRLARATWSPRGDKIVFTRPGSTSLWQVSAMGGESTVLWQPESDLLGYGRPKFLPDGRAILVEIGSQEAIGLIDMETLELHTLLRQGSAPAFAPSGHIIFARGSALYAVAFDARRRLISGEPTMVLDGVSETIGCAQFSFSKKGLLAYIESSPLSWESTNRSLVWVNREGSSTPLSDRQDAFTLPHISPDGTRIAVAANGRIWVFEIETDTWQVLTSDGYANHPVWSPDGEAIMFVAGWGPHWLYQPFSTPADFSGSAKQILDHEFSVIPRSFSPTGQLVLYEVHPSEERNILVLQEGIESPQYLVRTAFNEHSPMVSPNGRWLAYTSDRSGVDEVYVEPFPDGGPRVQISAGGGDSPRWAPEEQELFYRNGVQMIAVPVSTESNFAITGDRQILFESHAYVRPGYDVDWDGQRFLMIQQETDDAGESPAHHRVSLIFNWFEELERLVPTK
jgi:serine/threonine-protein kinase